MSLDLDDLAEANDRLDTVIEQVDNREFEAAKEELSTVRELVDEMKEDVE